MAENGITEGQLAANIFQENDADIVVHAAGSPGFAMLQYFGGVYKKPTIGYGVDEWSTYFGRGSVPGSEWLLTSVIKRYDLVVAIVLQHPTLWPLQSLLADNDRLGAFVDSGPCHETCRDAWNPIPTLNYSTIEAIRQQMSSDWNYNPSQNGLRCEGDVMDTRYRRMKSMASSNTQSIFTITFIYSLSLFIGF